MELKENYPIINLFWKFMYLDKKTNWVERVKKGLSSSKRVSPFQVKQPSLIIF